MPRGPEQRGPDWVRSMLAALLLGVGVRVGQGAAQPVAPQPGGPASALPADPAGRASSPDSLAPGAGASAAPLDAVLAGIVASWLAADAGTLVQAAGAGPVSLGLSGGAVGLYERGRCRLILERLFQSTVTQEFRFTNRRQAGGPSAVALADWSYRPRGDGSVRNDRVLVVLELDAGRWTIAEIQIVQ